MQTEECGNRKESVCKVTWAISLMGCKTSPLISPPDANRLIPASLGLISGC
jgi:hypothetical protein